MTGFYFIKEFLKENKIWITFGLIPFIVIPIILFSGDFRYIESDVLSIIENNGKRHIIYNGENGLTMTLADEFHKLSADEKTISVWTPSIPSVILSVYLIASVIAHIVVIASGDFEIGVDKCRVRSKLHLIKTYKENNRYYYQYKNKLIYESNDIAGSYILFDRVYDIEILNRLHVFPDYLGPKQVVRRNKIKQIFDQ